jgi:hypothetical protein
MNVKNYVRETIIAEWNIGIQMSRMPERQYVSAKGHFPLKKHAKNE